MNPIISLLYLFLGTFYSCNISAAGHQSFGDVASNLYEPLSIVINLVRAISVVCGAGLLLGSVLKYLEYRKNPVAVRLSTALFMVIFGVSLILIEFIPLHLNG